jgi:dipeptidyl aminopeptidase/acylaminoacyl peptidase
VSTKTIATYGIAFIAAVAVLSFVTGAIFCSATLHVPRRLKPAPSNAATVSIATADGTHLSAWWMQPAKPNGNCVVVLHGIGDSRAGSAGFAPLFLDEGYAVLLPDSRGHGASEGRFVTYGLMEKYDVIAWAHWLRGAGCRKLYALGESLGASILIQAASVEPAFAAIVAESAYADLREIAEYRVRQMSKMPDSLAAAVAKFVVTSAVFYARLVDHLDLVKASPVSVIGRVSTPILLIHGLADTRTPPWNSQKLAGANPRDPLWLVPNAEHTGASSTEPVEFRRRVLTWFAEH